MKRIGLICLALVLALGALGMGYALWWDEVTITGDVFTGSVDIEIVEVSETWVYKDLITRALIMSPEPLPPDPSLLYVASATATDVTVDDDEAVVMTFDNIFPTGMIPIVADVVLHYAGSVPAHVVYTEEFWGDDDLSPYLVQTWFIWDRDLQEWIRTPMADIQLHFCDLLKLEVYLDPMALQLAGWDAQGLNGGFTKTIFVHQWNEPLPP